MPRVVTEEAGDEAALQGGKGHFFIGLCPVLADRIDDNNAEDEGCQGIHGAVAIQKTLGEGLYTVPVAVGGRLPGSHGMDNGEHKEESQKEEKHRRNDLADAVYQFRGSDGEPPGNDEENKAENVEGHLLHGTSEERSHGDFKGRGGSTGRGEGRPNGDIQEDGEENGVLRMDPGSQGLEVTAGIADGCHRQDGKAHAGQKEADGGRNGIDAGILSHEYREYQVAGAKEQGEKHEPDGDEGIGRFLHNIQLLFRTRLPAGHKESPAGKIRQGTESVRYHLVHILDSAITVLPPAPGPWVQNRNSRLTRLLHSSSSHHPLPLWEDSKA